jgi:hypothetical protein
VIATGFFLLIRELIPKKPKTERSGHQPLRLRSKRYKQSGDLTVSNYPIIGSKGYGYRARSQYLEEGAKAQL